MKEQELVKRIEVLKDRYDICQFFYAIAYLTNMKNEYIAKCLALKVYIPSRFFLN